MKSTVDISPSCGAYPSTDHKETYLTLKCLVMHSSHRVLVGENKQWHSQVCYVVNEWMFQNKLERLVCANLVLMMVVTNREGSQSLTKMHESRRVCVRAGIGLCPTHDDLLGFAGPVKDSILNCWGGVRRRCIELKESCRGLVCIITTHLSSAL